MLINFLFRQAAAGSLAAAAEPQAKIIFLGMTGPELAAMGAGIVLGGALSYALYCKISKHIFGISKAKNSADDINIFENKKTLKSFNELLSNQEYIDTLDKSDLKDWFAANHVEIDDAKLMIALASDNVLKALGYDPEGFDAKKDKAMIQSVYNSKNGLVYKMRFITYKNIESNLEAEMLENDGLVILEE